VGVVAADFAVARCWLLPELPLLDDRVAVGLVDFVGAAAGDPLASGPLEHSKNTRMPNANATVGSLPWRGHARARRHPPASASRIDG
jgi:hypothetical protein